MSETFAEVFARVVRKQEEDMDSFIRHLRAKGIAAAHPDDGWVNREANELVMQYPWFNNGISKGSIIALGWPEKWRTVRITGKRTNVFGMTYWKFEACHE